MHFLLKLCCLSSILSFDAAAQNRFDVVITEIMADPAPQVGLPNAEYVEIRNISSTPVNINGWKLSDAASTASIAANFVLQPDSFVLLCANSNTAALSPFGRTLGVAGFPSLDNDGDQLVLRSAQGRVIHALNYTVGWYQNDIKRDGGWSLEMIDPANPCAGSTNWKASSDARGGTPGRTNSVNASNTDTAPPELLRTWSADSIGLTAVFSEPLDSQSAASIINYSLGEGPAVLSVTPQPPLFNEVLIKLAAPMKKQTLYLLSVSGIKDCMQNPIGSFNSAKAGWMEAAKPVDMVVNEILFDPKPNGYDYVELYNRSNKIIDASALYIAGRSATGGIASQKKMSERPHAIFPGDHVVVTQDAAALLQLFFVENPNNVFELSTMPSLPDDKGTVVTMNLQGEVIDEVTYSAKWHFALMTNPEGVALERIDPNGSSVEPGNWHSAASTSGYGTPTYKNSQHRLNSTGNTWIELQPKIFSPDNDGHDDFVSISYSMDVPGYVANLAIFDADGRLVNHLVNNALLELKGSWNWDGLDDRSQKLPAGVYVLHADIFNLEGKKRSFRRAIILARGTD